MSLAWPDKAVRDIKAHRSSLLTEVGGLAAIIQSIDSRTNNAP
jgi:hypothetical protein